MSAMNDGLERYPLKFVSGKTGSDFNPYEIIKDDFNEYLIKDTSKDLGRKLKDCGGFLDRVASMMPGAKYKMCGVVSHFARKDVTDRENHFLHLLNDICDSHVKWPTLTTVERVNKSCSSFMESFEGELGYQVMVYVTMVLEKVNEGDNDEQ